MKNSFYNLYTSCPQGVLCFNTNSDNYIIISETTYNLLQNKLYNHIKPSLLETLINNKFIIEDDIDEYKELIKGYHSIDSFGSYFLTLLPSLDCNVRCWYCFEKHVVGSHMTSIQLNAILKYAQHILDRGDIERLYFTLFGGEPMLYFKEEVYPLLIKIKEYAISCNKKFQTTIVTNATLISEEIIPLLAELNATFQISIDGYREKHNSIKKSSEIKEGTYDVVMKAIHQLTNAYDTLINLRINYDNQTFKHLHDVFEDIQDIDRKKIKIHLERVWQTQPNNSNNSTELRDIINAFLSQGFSLTYLNFNRRNYSCLMDLKNEAVLSYNGDVYRCTGRDFTENHKEGMLIPEGIIKWNEQKATKRLSIKTYDNEKCRECKLLPQCWGPCSQKQLEHPDNIKQRCPLNALELSMDDYIQYRFNNEFISLRNYGKEKPIELLK